jgi:methionyl-tRNA formyltransferase
MGGKVLQMAKDNVGRRRVLFWGMRGDFSALALEALLQAQVPLCGVLMPAAMLTPQMAPIQQIKAQEAVSSLPLSRAYVQRTAAHVAWEAGLPVWEVRQIGAAETAELVTCLQPSLALVACFPWCIPASLLALPAHGFFNLHPSLLPDLRGPYPLFWSFRLGKKKTGVTVHQMDQGFDTGPLALQREVHLPDGISGTVVDRLLGRQGGALLALAVQQLAAGTLRLQPQQAGGRAFPRPASSDFTIPTTWRARRAFNFMRGTADWHHPYRISGEGVDLYARQAVAYEPEGQQETAVLRDGIELSIQFAGGILHAR